MNSLARVNQSEHVSSFLTALTGTGRWKEEVQVGMYHVHLLLAQSAYRLCAVSLYWYTSDSRWQNKREKKEWELSPNMRKGDPPSTILGTPCRPRVKSAWLAFSLLRSIDFLVPDKCKETESPRSSRLCSIVASAEENGGNFTFVMAPESVFLCWSFEGKTHGALARVADHECELFPSGSSSALTHLVTFYRVHRRMWPVTFFLPSPPFVPFLLFLNSSGIRG